MKRRSQAALAAATLALAGCGGPWREIEQRRILAEDQSAAQRACLQEARNAPAVRILSRQVNPMDNNFAPQERVVNEKTLAENQAFRDCLRRAGYRDPGGVEPIMPRDPSPVFAR